MFDQWSICLVECEPCLRAEMPNISKLLSSAIIRQSVHCPAWSELRIRNLYVAVNGITAQPDY